MPVVIFILSLVCLVLIHELGHFLIAKKFNIKVLEFGFGIPPRAWGKMVGETLLSLNWLPFGGFVRLLGEDDDDPEVAKDPRSFSAQKVSKRITVVVAGVVMNLLLSWVLFYIVIIYGGFSIIIPASEPQVIVEHVDQGSPAAQANLQVGQRILSVNNTSVNSEEDLLGAIGANLGKQVSLTVASSDGSNPHSVMLTPRKNPPKNQGPLGIAMSPFAYTQYKTVPEKILSAPTYSFQLGKLIITGTGGVVGDLFHGNFKKVSSQVAGPVGVAALSSSLLKSNIDSIMTYIYFIGYISLTLSIMNVLPIPALDGGRLFFLLIEAVTRKKVHPTAERYIHSAGMIVLLGLLVLITISDVRKLIS